MSSFNNQFTDGTQLEIHFPENLAPPTFHSNLLMANVLQDEVYLRFCLRSVERPMVRADLQCRVLTSIAQARKIVEGLGKLLAQYDEQMAQLQAREEAEQAAQAAREQAAQMVQAARK